MKIPMQDIQGNPRSTMAIIQDLLDAGCSEKKIKDLMKNESSVVKALKKKWGDQWNVDLQQIGSKDYLNVSDAVLESLSIGIKKLKIDHYDLLLLIIMILQVIGFFL